MAEMSRPMFPQGTTQDNPKKMAEVSNLKNRRKLLIERGVGCDKDCGPTLVILAHERRAIDIYVLDDDIFDYPCYCMYNNKSINDGSLNESDRKKFSELMDRFHTDYQDYHVDSLPDEAKHFKNTLVFRCVHK